MTHFLAFVNGVCMCDLFFFKQKAAYDVRIRDWSSDVCSSDLRLTDYRALSVGPFDSPTSMPRPPTAGASSFGRSAGADSGDSRIRERLTENPVILAGCERRAGGRAWVRRSETRRRLTARRAPRSDPQRVPPSR